MTSTGRRKRALRGPSRAGLALLASSVLAVSGCSEDNKAADPEPSKSASSTPAPAASSKAADPEAQAESEVLAAYGRFWIEQSKAYAQGSTKGTDLKRYAVGNALAQAESDLLTMKQKGVRAEGQPTIKATVETVDPRAEVPKATLKDCLDISTWKRVDKKTGKELPAPSERLDRYVTVVKAEKWGKQWKILDVKPQQKAC
ncbi:hypothetical protein ACFQVC_32750 [Streptomyces monticola]|uniref:Secreted protein/lipoprotein n=1 Tax=Streptomyces monticola TaxID=2666263 RepID=A0ABW2JS02_9ACTN